MRWVILFSVSFSQTLGWPHYLAGLGTMEGLSLNQRTLVTFIASSLMLGSTPFLPVLFPLSAALGIKWGRQGWD